MHIIARASQRPDKTHKFLADMLIDELADKLEPLFEKVPFVVIVSARNSIISRCDSHLSLPGNSLYNKKVPK